MVSLPSFNLGQGTQQSLLSSTPLIHPQSSQPSGLSQFSSTPFPSSSAPQPPALNLSGLAGQTGTATSQPFAPLGAPSTRPQGASLGLTAASSQGFALGNPLAHSQGPGALGGQGSTTARLGAASTQATSGQGIIGGLLGQPLSSSLGASTGPGQATQLGGGSTQPLGLNLGATTTNQSAGLIGGGGASGLGLSKNIPQPQTYNLSVSTAKPLGPIAPAPTSVQPTQPQVLTLGGPLPQSGSGSLAQQQAIPNDVKDMEIEPVFDQLLKNLSTHIKQQKEIQAGLGKMEMRALQSCDKDCKELVRSLAEWKRGVSEYSGQVSSLKEDSLQDIRVAEVAQRTHELPASHQGEHNDPRLYFQMLVRQFSEKLAQYQQVVEELAKNFSQIDNQTKTPQEVSDTLKLLNDNFISLAATIYSLHTRVTQLKDNVVAYSSIYSKDTQLRFPKRIPNASSGSRSNGELKSGPTPFSLSEASLLSQKYTLGGFGSDLHLQTPANAFNTLHSNFSTQRTPTLSLGKTQDLSLSSHSTTPIKFSSFQTGPSHTPQKTAVPPLNLSLIPQPATLASSSAQGTLPSTPVQYPQGFSPLRRGSISGESEESKRKK